MPKKKQIEPGIITINSITDEVRNIALKMAQNNSLNVHEQRYASCILIDWVERVERRSEGSTPKTEFKTDAARIIRNRNRRIKRKFDELSAKNILN